MNLNFEKAITKNNISALKSMIETYQFDNQKELISFINLSVQLNRLNSLELFLAYLNTGDIKIYKQIVYHCCAKGSLSALKLILDTYPENKMHYDNSFFIMLSYSLNKKDFTEYLWFINNNKTILKANFQDSYLLISQPFIEKKINCF